MTTTIGEMTAQEQYMQEENPRLLKAQQMTGSIRWLELYRSYLLAEELADLPRDAHKETIDAWAYSMGMTPGTLAGHLGWARAIDLQQLTDCFEGEGISEQEWTQRIGTSHLKEIAKAKHQDTNLVLSPGRMVDLVIECYHANWSVAELKEELRRRNLRAPARGMNTTPTRLPTRLSEAFRRVADQVEASGDVDIQSLTEEAMQERRRKGKADKPIAAEAFACWLAGLLKERMPDLTISLVGGTVEGGKENESA